MPRWASADRGNKPTLRRTALGPCPVVCRGLAVCKNRMLCGAWAMRASPGPSEPPLVYDTTSRRTIACTDPSQAA